MTWSDQVMEDQSSKSPGVLGENFILDSDTPSIPCTSTNSQRRTSPSICVLFGISPEWRLDVVLIKRAEEPFIGKLALPGGCCEHKRRICRSTIGA
jgi:hypothetical protein